MSSVASGNITQTDLTGLNYVFTDTGSYTAPVTSRILTQYDSNGNLINTYNMGGSLTQPIAVIADGYFTFILNITDATGPVAPLTINELLKGIYIAAYLSRLTLLGCCDCNSFSNIDKAELAYNGAVRYGIGGDGPNAQTQITLANVLINS